MTVLYRMYGNNNELLYVGITGDPDARLKAHQRNSAWYPMMRSARHERFDTLEMALAAEKQVIKVERPLYNKTHSTRQPDSTPANKHNQARHHRFIA